MGAELPKDSPFDVRKVVRKKLELKTVWAQWEGGTVGGSDAFTTSELVVQRILLPLSGAIRDAAQQRVLDTSYLEILTQYERPQMDATGGLPSRLHARQRVVQYTAMPGMTTPMTARERDAAGAATLLLDYDWELQRLT